MLPDEVKLAAEFAAAVDGIDDPELVALTLCLTMLKPLTIEGRKRVLHYLEERFAE